MAANWWDMPTTVTSEQQKNYVGSPSAGGLPTPMAPLPSVGTAQPVTPFPGVASVGKQPPLVSLSTAGARPASGGMPPMSTAGLFGGGADPNKMPTAWREMAPGYGTDVAAQRAGQAIELSPEGYQLLQNSPQLAQWLTDRSRLAAQAERERLGGMSESMLGAVEYGQETPGYSAQYWNARTQRARADSAAKFQVKRQIAEDNLASGRWTDARYRRELANIQDESLQDIGNAMGALETERGQEGEKQRLARADRYLALMQAETVKPQDWWSANFGYEQPDASGGGGGVWGGGSTSALDELGQMGKFLRDNPNAKINPAIKEQFGIPNVPQAPTVEETVRKDFDWM